MVCNEQGFDPISFGATVGAVMEMYENGTLDEKTIGLGHHSARRNPVS